MPISSKIIISTIDNMSGSFTKSDLHNILIKPRQDRETAGAPNKRKKQSPYKPQKDLSKIEDTLNALQRAGFILRGKKSFKKSGDMKIKGIMKVNSSGDSIIKNNEEDIIVTREDRKSAQNNDDVTVKVYDYKKRCFYGRVVQVTKRNNDKYIAKVSGKSGDLIYFSIPDMPSEIEACCKRKGKNPAMGNFAVLTFTGDYISNKPECRIIEYFEDDNEDYDFLRIKNRHNVPDDYGNKDIPQDLTIPESELQNRKDYTRLFTVTIDGETAKDFDDAVSIKKAKGSTKLYVHIADVSAYVSPGSDLDQKAFSRGTSYYLGNKVVPMLPEILSNDLCSLKEGEKRYTLTAEMNFNSKGKLTKFEAHRGIIKVNKRMTYNSATKILEKKSLSRVSDNLHKMWELAKILNNKRSSGGRLDLNLTDQEIIYDENKVKEIKFAVRLKSHTLIEEFMLSANEAVSKALRESEFPALYRVHEKISIDNLISLKKFLSVVGIKLPAGGHTGQNIQQVLQKVSGKPYEQVVNLVVLKSMMSAFYGAEPLGHFGLGFADYTHFTSPIRRYPDLIVHRCLKNLIDASKPTYRLNELIEIGEKSSLLERVAQKAERDLMKLKSCRIMKDRAGEEFDVIISGMTKFGLFVSLIEMPIEGMIPLKNLTDDYYILKEDDYTVIGRKYNRRFRLGDRIKAKLATVDIETLRIDFVPAEVPKKRRKR